MYSWRYAHAVAAVIATVDECHFLAEASATRLGPGDGRYTPTALMLRAQR